MAENNFTEFCLTECANCTPSVTEFRRRVLQALCNISAAGPGGGGTSGPTAQSFVFTDSNGAPFIVLLTPGDPPTVEYFELDGVTPFVPVGAASPAGTTCNNPVQVAVCADNFAGALVSSTVTGPVTIPIGKLSVSVINVGAANGVVDGQPLLPGEAFSVEGFWSPGSGGVFVLPAISIDGTGTTLRVRTFG